MKARTLALTAALAAGPAAAQDAGWTFQASLYGWLPGLSTTVGTDFGEVELDSDGGDVLSALEMTFMGTIEARNGRWGLIGDFLYVDLSNETDAPLDRRFSAATLGAEATAFSGYAVYRTYETDRLAIDAGAGFRAFDLDLSFGLESADSRPDFEADGSETWAVPVVAVRAIVPITETWFATAFVDGGLGADDSSTWQVFGSVGYRFSDRWSAQAGWRYMAIDKDIAGLDLSMGLSGPLIGVSARF